jgi:alkaline phosphatase D
MKMFRRLRFGNLLEFHVLDTRQYRSDQPCGDGRKPQCEGAFNKAQTMMGPSQEKWLMDGLGASKARWNVVANQVLISQLARIQDGVRTFQMDKWDGYVDARSRLMRFMAHARPSNPVAITGDIHASFVADLKLDFDDPSSPVVGTEFVGTSITSGGDGDDSPGAEMRALNPHVKFYNSRRGYVRATITPSLWTSDYRVLPYVSRPDAPIETRASFVVESGRPGAQPG